MDLVQFTPYLITFLSAMIGAFITIRITIVEIKKDISFLKEKLESELVSKLQAEKQAKDDMKEVKDELKMILKSIHEIQINFTRMEARSEGKDEVIDEFRKVTSTILKQRG